MNCTYDLRAFALFLSLILGSQAVTATPLTLRQAMQNTLVNNLAIKRQEASIAESRENVIVAEGEFGTSAFASVNYEDLSRRQNAIEFTSTGEINPNRIFEEENFRARMGLRKKLSYGTILEAGVESSRLANTITESGGAAIFDPEYESNFTLSMVQPLLKNFSRDANLIDVSLAEIAVDKSDYQRQMVVTNQLIEVINAFYDSLFGQANVEAKQQSLDVAKALLHANERRKTAGQMSAIDVAVAGVRVSEAEEEMWIAANFLNERKAILTKLLATESSSTGFELAGKIESADPAFDFATLSSAAREYRPDLQLARAALEEESLRSRYAANQSLPELNLSVIYGANGLEESTSESIDRALDNRENNIRVGLNFEMPVSRKNARATKRSAQFAVDQVKLQIALLERNVDVDLQSGLQRLENIKKRIGAAERSLKIAEQALIAEEKRLSNGQSTTFEVIQLQEAVSSAQTRVLASQADSLKVVNEIQALSGTLIAHHGFVL